MYDKSLSLTFRVGKGVLDHNNRIIVADNVDRKRICHDIIYKHDDLRELYHELFDEAQEEYNARQTREDRKIHDYYEHIKNSSQEKLFYEVVVYVGRRETSGYGAPYWNDAKEVCDEYMKEFERRNPNMKIFNAVLHLDETAPHLHIDYVPICENQTRGLSRRVSQKMALEQQGIFSKGSKKSEWSLWKDREVDYLTEILHKRGFEREIVGANYPHMETKAYKQYMDKLRPLISRVETLTKENPQNFSQEDMSLLANQNELLREDIKKLQQQLHILYKRNTSPFERFEVFNSEKLSYITSELDRLEIPYVEEENAVNVPTYAIKTCKNIAATFKPSKVNLRDAIKMDIDVLLLSCESLEQLWEKLKEQGYEIKKGTYLVVKAPQAERFVRLKSLGEDYLPDSLERRIAEKDEYPKAVESKLEASEGIEKKFYAEIRNTIAAVQTLRYYPRKTVPGKVYSFGNDVAIDNLSAGIQTMNEFGITSRERMEQVAAELEEKISVGTDYDDVLENKIKLARIDRLMKTYERITEGNFIDDLIKGQQEVKNVGQNKGAVKL